MVELPEGVTAGHWTDREGWTGCTAILGPPESVSAGEIRGGGPGTREFDLLSPATSTQGAQAFVLAGGSAFGLAAAEGAAAWMAERGRGFETPDATIPLVTGAVVYDLQLGGPARPDAAAGYAACEAAAPELERGSVGAGTGCTAGKLLGPGSWTKSGLGAASEHVGDVLVTAIAAANPIGDVVAADGSVLAGVWRDGAWARTVDLVRAGYGFGLEPAREATTLVCLLTDARLTKTEAWKVARAGTAGLARAIAPCSTALDGDLVTCLATGRTAADPFALEAIAAEVVAAAIRDAAAQATAAPGCPTGRERLLS